MKQDGDRSELQDRVAAELREKMSKTSQTSDSPDFVEDSRYQEGTKSGSNIGMILMVVVAIVLLVVAAIFLSQKFTN